MVSKTLMMFFALVALVATVQSAVPQCPAEDGAGSMYFADADDCQ